MLADAATSFTELDATSFLLETRARQAEVAVLQGDSSSAIDLGKQVLADAGEASGMPPLESNIHRIRAAALLQLDRPDDAGAAIDESVAIARKAGATFQLALALDLLARMDGDRDAASESAELLAQLGVERVARPPLPDC